MLIGTVLYSECTNWRKPILTYSKAELNIHSNIPYHCYNVTYNPTTGIYRPVVLDANKNLFFEESDYFINDSDGMYYTCVIYKAVAGWGSNYFNTALPVCLFKHKNL